MREKTCNRVKRYNSVWQPSACCGVVCRLYADDGVSMIAPLKHGEMRGDGDV